jgi:hypothetical protein
MQTTFRTVLILVMVITVSGLLTQWWGGGAAGRAEFARYMTDPAEGLTAWTRGPAKEILVIQIPGTTLSHSDNLFEGRTLTQLRKRGFTRAEVRGSDGQTLVEKDLE